MSLYTIINAAKCHRGFEANTYVESIRDARLYTTLEFAIAAKPEPGEIIAAWEDGFLKHYADLIQGKWLWLIKGEM